MFTVHYGPFLKKLKLFYFYVAILDIITMADVDFRKKKSSIKKIAPFFASFLGPEWKKDQKMHHF